MSRDRERAEPVDREGGPVGSPSRSGPYRYPRLEIAQNHVEGTAGRRRRHQAGDPRRAFEIQCGCERSEHRAVSGHERALRRAAHAYRHGCGSTTRYIERAHVVFRDAGGLSDKAGDRSDRGKGEQVEARTLRARASKCLYGTKPVTAFGEPRFAVPAGALRPQGGRRCATVEACGPRRINRSTHCVESASASDPARPRPSASGGRACRGVPSSPGSGPRGGGRSPSPAW